MLGALGALFRKKRPPKEIRLPERRRPHSGTGLVIVAIFRNEAPYLVEWIEFHRLVGAHHFILYDNGSDDASTAVLAPYIEAGIVTVMPWQTFALGINAQRLAYAHAVVNFGWMAEWLACIDIDEFLFSERQVSVLPLLDALQGLDGLYVPRFEFGPSGHTKPPAGLVIENYLERARISDTPKVKSLVRAVRATGMATHRSLVEGRVGTLPHEGGPLALRINHYFTKSTAEFAAKLARGWPEGASRDLEHKREHFDSTTIDTVRDTSILALASLLRVREEPTRSTVAA